jgi:TetR/AcrR family transcriptional repressor of nem operon
MNRKQELLQVAEKKVREGGYNNFSFRELAKEIGIKSASVHYHFPTKEDLAAQLAKQYTDNFINALGNPKTLYDCGTDPIIFFASLFKHSLEQDKKMCLCGLLGAESDILPPLVRVEIKRFFRKNLAWLEQAYSYDQQLSEARVKQLAIQTISLLEGAMMISIVNNDNTIFDSALAGLISIK